MDDTYKVSVSRFALDKKIQYGDPFWQTFNGSFNNRSLTRMDFADAIYTGHPFTTWHRCNWRTSANYELGQHIGLDFDTEDQRSTLTALGKDSFVKKYASLIYTTPSHTPEKPKARVVFLLDEPIHQAKNYALSAAALLWVFGTADRQCKDPARFFYGSKGCQMEYMENVLPLATVKHLIQQYQESGRREHRRQTRDWTHTTDQAEVADAMRRIPAWGISYDEWVSVLMALHREYGDAGFGLAEAWADGAPNEVERKWKSFHEQGNYAGAVGLGTVFALAKRFGWSKTLQ